MKRTVLLVTAVCVFGLATVVGAQEPLPAIYVDITEVGGLDEYGRIPEGGTDLVIPIRFHNIDFARTVISNGYYFNSDDITIGSISVEWNPDYPWYYSSTCLPWDCYPYFDGIIGEVPIDKGLGGYGMYGITGIDGIGLPADFNDVAYTITLHDVNGPLGSKLTMDSTSWEPGGVWAWSPTIPTVSWGGPYEFSVGWWLIPPRIISTPPMGPFLPGDHFYYDVDAVGAPEPTYSLTVYPEGMTIDHVTGEINWICGPPGIYLVTVVASNGSLDAVQSFEIQVMPCPTPIITSEPVTEGRELEPYAYDVFAFAFPEPTYKLLEFPDGMVIDEITGLITWTPALGQAGIHPVTVQVNNQCGDIIASAQQHYDLAIQIAYEAPSIDAVDNQRCLVEQTFTFKPTLVEDVGPVTWSIDGPDGMTINETTGEISYFCDTEGDFPVVIHVANNTGSDSEDFILTVYSCDEPYTTCWPEPIELKALENDRILNVSIWCEDFSQVDMSSIRVFNISPYTEARIEGDSLVTDVFVMRFLGSGGFRPIPSEGYTDAQYSVSYTMNDGTLKTLYGIFDVDVTHGDVNFDGVVNIEDVVLMADWLFTGGPKARLWNEDMDECMDIDGSGRVDLLDVRALIETIY